MALTTLLTAPASASVNIEVVAADLQDRSGTLMPVSGVAALVADTGTNGFTDPQPSFQLSAGATWGVDDKVLSVWDLSGTGTPGFLDGFTVISAYSGALAQGQRVQLYWFPSLTLASNTVGATYYGKYTDTNSPPLDGGDAWVLPADGSSVSLVFITQSEGGSNPDTAGRATLFAGANWFLDDFGTFNQNTNLVPQQGWALFGGTANEPYVTNNAVFVGTFIGPANADEPYKSFPQVSAITNPTDSVFCGMVITVTSAAPSWVATPTRILTFFERPDVGGASNFARDMLTVRDTGGSTQFVFGIRINGISSNPYAFGTTPLNYNTACRVIVQGRVDNTNTYVYVNPTNSVLDIANAYVTTNVAVASAADPDIGAVQIGNTFSAATPTNFQAGVAFSKIAASTNYTDVYNFIASQAQQLYWAGGSGDFGNALNWIPIQTPAPGIATFFTNNASYTVNFSSDFTDMDTATFSGQTAVVTLNLAGNTWSVTNQFRVGRGANATGTVYLASGTLAVENFGAAQIRIGDGVTGVDSAAGALFVTNGTLIADTINLGVSSNAAGKLVVSGSGVLTNTAGGGSLTVATVSSQPNQLIITNGGKVTVQGEVRIGSTGASNNLLLVSGPNSVLSIAGVIGSVRIGAGSSRGNMMIISNGAKLVTSNGGTIGGNGNGTMFNTGIVVGVGTAWLPGPGGTNASIIVGTNTGGNSNNTLIVYDGALLTSVGTLTIGNAVGSLSNSFNMGGVGSPSTGSCASVRIPVTSTYSLLNFTNSYFTANLLTFSGATNTMTISRNARFVLSNSIDSVFANTGNATNNLVLNSGTNNLMIIDGGTVDDVSKSNVFGMVVGAGNRLVVTNGGKLLTELGTLGSASSYATAMVVGVGSVWSNKGDFSSGTVRTNVIVLGAGTNASNNYLQIFSGATLYNSGSLLIGNSPTSTLNVVQFGGAGSSSTVHNDGAILVGGSAGSVANRLTITNAFVNCGTLLVGALADAFNPSGTNNLLEILGGTVNVSSLQVRGTNSISFNAGTLNIAGTMIEIGANDGAVLSVGDGLSAATLHLLGGTHSFANNLRVRNNATLSGCGTVTGNVVVDTGGYVQADCGSTFIFTGTVTNNGTISAIAGTTVSFSVLMVNNGAIVATNGTVQFNGGVINNGTILTNSPSANSWIDGNGKWERGSNWSLSNAPSSFDSADLITNAGNSTVTIDAATTNSPSTMIISNLTVSAPPGSTNSLVLMNSGTAVPLQVLSNFTADGNASIVVSNGALIATNAGAGFSIGYAGVSNQMSILAGGKVQTAVGHVGFTNTSSGNLVLVAGAGSVWTNQAFLHVGHDGWNNQLVISNGGAVYNLDGVVGFSNTSSNNTALVTGASSVWSNVNNLYVGNSGAGNVLVIDSGGVVSAGGYGIVGLSGNNNNAVVSGTGSVFSSQSTFNYLGGDYALQVGRFGSGNSLIVSNGGLALNTASIGAAGIGTGSGANSNRVVVTGSGSVWSNSNSGMLIGWDGGNSDSLVVSNGGIVNLSHGSIELGSGGDDNSVVVSDPGSVLNLYYQITLALDGNHHGNTLIISNGALLVSSFGVGSPPAYIGSGNSSSTSNRVFIAGSGSVWSNQTPIIFGDLGSRSNTMVVSSGGIVVSGLDGNPSAVGHSGNNNSVLVTGSGSIWNNPSELDLGSNGGSGNSLAIDSGAFVTASNLVVYPGNSLSLNGGTMTTTVGLTISNNATLTGCGTITGSVRVDGTVQANCGSTLNFTGILTNNGVLTATAGTVLRLYGPVVNNGVIDVTHGGATFFSTLSGSGTVLFSPTNSWISGDGKWETATNWSSGITPSLADSADFIANAGNNTVTIDAVTAGSFSSTLSISNLTISAPLNMTNTLLLSDAGTNTPLAVRDTVRVGSGGAMFITNSALKVSGPKGGTVSVDGQLTLVDDGTILVSSNLLVGALDPLGTVNILGGALYVTNAAHNAVTEVRYGTVMLTNGLYATDSLLITNPGANFLNNGGTFTITGLSQVDQGTQTVASGTTEISSNLLIGSSVDSTGTVNVAGGQLIVTNASITIGDLGVGIMTVSNAAVSTISVDIGAGTNSQGTLTLQDDSDVTISSNLTAGSASGATGIVNIAGGSLTVTNGTLGVGNDGTVSSGSGTGFMSVSNATVTASTILLGSSAGGQGEITLDDGGVIQGSGTNAVLICNGFGQIGGDLSWTNIGSAIYCGYTHPGVFALSNGTSACQDMYVGYDNSGTMTVAGGTMNILSRLIVGQLSSPLSAGAVWITGGQLTMASFTIIGNSGIGQMVISNGIVSMTDVFVGNGSNPGALTLAGGTLTVNNIVVPNANGRFTFSAGCLNAKTISNASGRVITLGDGINPATLNFLNSISSSNQGLTVSAGSKLSGLGSISGGVMNFGFLMAPAGLLNISDTVTNFGTVLAAGGGTINFNGPVVNNGIIVTNKGVHFNAGMTNNGTLVDANGDPDHDGFNNLSEYEAGTNPNDPKSTPLQITSIVQQNNDVLVTWLTAGGTTNFVQATTGGSGNYSNNFTDLSPTIVPAGNDLISANYLDTGAITNFTSRYYRIRFAP